MIVLKTSHELSLMREACRISAGALKVAGEAVEPGVTTAQIDKIAHEYILKAGATPTFLNYNGFPATACISINDEIIHGIPSHRRVIKSGDIVDVYKRQENNTCGIGDRVLVMETRPMSKDKRWRVVEIIEKAK